MAEVMLVSTTSTIPGYEIIELKGIVTHHVMEGVDAIRDFGVKISDFVGGRSGVLEKALQRADSAAVTGIWDQAVKAGANAVIGIALDYETIQIKGTMMLCVAVGTAVVVRRLPTSQSAGPDTKDVKPSRPGQPASVPEPGHEPEAPSQQERYEQRPIGADFEHDR